MISATVVADSLNTDSGARLTTFSLVMPKQLVAQFNTYGMIRRDSASSRAVPTRLIIAQVQDNPYLPAVWRYRQRGMSPAGEMTPAHARAMTIIERRMRRSLLRYVGQMEQIGAAKEDINRYLEAWMYTTVVATATEWDNYFEQRISGDAQAAHATLAIAMRAAMDASVPVDRSPDMYNAWAWHLPYVTEDERQEIPIPVLTLISSARCAGVSYFRQGDVGTLDRQIERGKELVKNRHWSPTEMACRVMPTTGYGHSVFYGPYRDWIPLRKFYGGESGSVHFGTQEDAPWVLR